MFTKEYCREVLEQMCTPYMTVPLSDEFVDRIYDGFVKIRNGEAVEQVVQRTACTHPNRVTNALGGVFCRDCDARI